MKKNDIKKGRNPLQKRGFLPFFQPIFFLIFAFHQKFFFMPLQNLGKVHLTAAQQTTVDTALAQLLSVAQAVSPNFDENDRLKYGSINELNKLLLLK